MKIRNVLSSFPRICLHANIVNVMENNILSSICLDPNFLLSSMQLSYDNIFYIQESKRDWTSEDAIIVLSLCYISKQIVGQRYQIGT